MLLEPELQRLDLILWQYVFYTPPFRCVTWSNLKKCRDLDDDSFWRAFSFQGFWNRFFEARSTKKHPHQVQQVNLVAPWGNDSTFTTGMFFFTILLYHRRPYDFWDHLKWRPCCLDHPFCFFRLGNLSQKIWTGSKTRIRTKRVSPMHQFPWKKQKTALSVEGLRGGWVWKLEVFGPTFWDVFFFLSRSESSLSWSGVVFVDHDMP